MKGPASAIAVAIAMAALQTGHGADAALSGTASSGVRGATPMKIQIKVKNTLLRATLLDSEAARDFASLLPLSLPMNDLFRREKYGHLPRAISEGGKRTHTYEVGDIAYWPPGPDVAIYYRNDGERIPQPGIVVLGRIESGIEALDLPGSMNVTIELLRDAQGRR
jgi:hypothetical protein